MKKIIKYITKKYKSYRLYKKYLGYFSNDSKKIENIIIDNFKKINYYPKRVSVDFYFGYNTDLYTDYFYGKKQFGIIRVDYQGRGTISSFYSIKDYLKHVHSKLL